MCCRACCTHAGVAASTPAAAAALQGQASNSPHHGQVARPKQSELQRTSCSLRALNRARFSSSTCSKPGHINIRCPNHGPASPVASSSAELHAVNRPATQLVCNASCLGCAPHLLLVGGVLHVARHLRPPLLHLRLPRVGAPPLQHLLLLPAAWAALQARKHTVGTQLPSACPVHAAATLSAAAACGVKEQRSVRRAGLLQLLGASRDYGATAMALA